MNTNDLPVITIGNEDYCQSYEVEVPAKDLPANLTNVTLSDRGLYLELANGRWDLIPFSELADLVDTAGARTHAKPSRNGKHTVHATVFGIPVLGTVEAGPDGPVIRFTS